MPPAPSAPPSPCRTNSPPEAAASPPPPAAAPGPATPGARNARGCGPAGGGERTSRDAPPGLCDAPTFAIDLNGETLLLPSHPLSRWGGVGGGGTKPTPTTPIDHVSAAPSTTAVHRTEAARQTRRRFTSAKGSDGGLP